MEINTRDVNDIAVFEIAGEIRRTDTPGATLHQLVKSSLDRGRRNILLNLKSVEFVDSFGVGEILASYISTQNLGGKLKLSGISKKLYLVFQVTMLTRVLDICETEDAALKSFGKT